MIPMEVEHLRDVFIFLNSLITYITLYPFWYFDVAEGIAFIKN